MGQCKLCRQEKELLKRSHIIPDFMYQELYNEHHQINSFNPLDMLAGKGYVKRPSSGEYEGGLLCSTCDTNVIGLYESYASKASYGGLLHQNESPTCQNYINYEGISFTHCENINYQKFKLFLLSILWRASISSRPMFSNISLGDNEEIIRKMLLAGAPGKNFDYPIFIMTHRTDESIPKDLIGHPQKIVTKNGLTYFIFMITGMLYCFYLNIEGVDLPKYVLDNTIKDTNEMNIIHLPKGTAWDFFKVLHGMVDKPNA